MPHLVPVMEAAQMLAGKLAPLDPDREAVKEAILNTVLVGWQDHNLELHLAGYTADAVVVTQRDEKPGPHDVTLTRAQLAVARRLDFRGPVSDTIRFLHDRWQIQVTGDTAVARCRSVVVVPPIPNTFAGYSGFWDVEDRMRKEGGRWKIAHGWSHQLRDTISDKGAVAYDAAHWARADAAVRAAKTDADRLAALVAAQQYAVALPLARKLTTGSGATAQAWSHRATVAKALGEANEAETAAREAARLDPAGFPLPFWATK